jgi:hypothetical protein
MRKDLHSYLDGELPRAALPPDAAAEAAEWDALLDAAAASDLRAPSNLEARVMAALPPRPVPGRSAWRRALDWLVLPQSIQLRPVGVLAGAAAIAVLVLVPWLRSTGPRVDAPVAGTAAGSTVYVQFVFASERASTVSVAGDFNSWNASANTLRDADGDGVWTGLIAVQPGVH